MVSAGGANTWRCGHYVTAVSLTYVPIVTSQEKASFFLVNTVLKKKLEQVKGGLFTFLAEI